MKKNILLPIFIAFMAVIIDQWTKYYFLSVGKININTGIALGLFSDSPMSIRILSLCSFAGLLIFIYTALLILLHSKLFGLRIALSLLMGGIMGNVVDRMFRGFSIDFIPLFSLSLNIADIFQWISFFFLAYKIIFKDKEIWFPQNQRGKFIVIPKEQYYLSTKITIIMALCSLIFGIFCLSFFTTYLANSSKSYIPIFIIGYGSLTALACSLTFIISLKLSHKFAGPLYAFELYVEKLLNGHDEAFKLRQEDRHQHLINVAEKLRKTITKNAKH